MGFCWRASNDCESCFNALIPGPQLPLGLFTIADKGWRQSRQSKAWSDISRWAEQEEEEEEGGGEYSPLLPLPDLLCSPLCPWF